MKQPNLHLETYVIIPAYNEGKAIRGVLETVTKRFKNVVCINDGSRDNTGAEIAKTKAILVSHATNLGQGAGLQTGVEYALQDLQAKYFITFDADGQHSLDDAERMLEYIKSHPVDIVMGSRFLGETKNMSKVKKMILKMAVAFQNTTTGVKLTDAHNGLRVFNRDFAEKLNITMPDMAHATEIIQRVYETKARFKEFPVTITYSDYSVAKSHNPNLNAVNIVFDTLIHRMTKK